MKIKDVFLKYILQWSDNYQLLFQRSRLLSQIPVFIIAIIAFCEIAYTFYAISKAENIAWEIVVNALTFQFLIAFLFAARFFLILSKSKISFWISQLVWLAYFIVLVRYFNEYERYCFRVSEALIFFYMVLSFVRQITSLIFSIIKTWQIANLIVDDERGIRES